MFSLSCSQRTNHALLEAYCNGVDGTSIQDRFAEGVMINVVEWGRKAVSNGDDLEARTQAQWASIVALNGWVNAGNRDPVHTMKTNALEDSMQNGYSGKAAWKFRPSDSAAWA